MMVVPCTVLRVQRIFLFMGGGDGVIDFEEWMGSHQALGTAHIHTRTHTCVCVSASHCYA